jgi:DNA invertase Pin-like site-specific DNA recombinase
LHFRNVELVVSDQKIDTSTATGKLLFNMHAFIAEFEAELRKERQFEGIAKVKERGVKFGAKAKLSDEQAEIPIFTH